MGIPELESPLLLANFQLLFLLLLSKLKHTFMALIRRLSHCALDQSKVESLVLVFREGFSRALIQQARFPDDVGQGLLQLENIDLRTAPLFLLRLKVEGVNDDRADIRVELTICPSNRQLALPNRIFYCDWGFFSLECATSKP